MVKQISFVEGAGLNRLAMALILVFMMPASSYAWWFHWHDNSPAPENPPMLPAAVYSQQYTPPPPQAHAILRSVTSDSHGTLVFNTDAGQKLVIKKQFVLTQPGRLVIDLANVDLPLNEGLQIPDGSLKSLPIQAIRVGKNDDQTLRIVIDTPHPYRFKVSQSAQDGGQMTVAYSAAQLSTFPTKPLTLAPAPVFPKHRGLFTVVVDAGHGGKDYGAIREGVNEKDLNLAVSLKLKQALEARGYTVYMRRSTDKFDDLPQISTFTNTVHPDVFVSVHTNASTSPEARGVETYYYTPQSQALAYDVQRQLAKTVSSPDRGVQTARFYVIHHTNVPAILCEMGYISNPDERSALQSAQRQKQTAEAIANGIGVFLQHTLQAQVP